jgi:hypothetical protein
LNWKDSISENIGGRVALIAVDTDIIAAFPENAIGLKKFLSR